MTPDRWQRVQEVLAEATEREPGERATFLEETCRDDPELRTEVESLLSSLEAASSGFLESPAIDAVPALSPTARRTGVASLTRGVRLGPYEILSPLGAGGMGEVYRARDTKLDRDVAIKVLPESVAADPDTLARFEREAKAVAALSHPNILAIHDFGSFHGVTYAVMELLDGQTLRGKLDAAFIPQRQAVDYAVQIAHGLAAAHEKGIVHRDLKPENVVVTKGGRVKILDFGLAKLKRMGEEGPLTEMAAAPAGTEPGVVLGTLGYMSPEQVRGLPADHRSDIFSFGSVLYEMLSRRKAFLGGSAAETMAAILNEDPPDLLVSNQNVHPGLERIMRHCLEKSPEQRFQSASDIAFALEALSSVSGPRPTLSGEKRRLSLTFFICAMLAMALVCGALAYLGIKKARERPPPSFHQLTFRRGQILSARFAPDGETVVYSAAWDGKPMELFVVRPQTPESKPFGLSGAEVLAISRSGEMAVSLNRSSSWFYQRSGTLVQLSISGGAAPRDILEEVEWADWAPDGKSLAVVRKVGRQRRLEYPLGKALYETTGWVSHPRVAPAGDLVAFIDHPVPADDGGSLALVDRSGRKRTLSGVFASAQGLAWSPGGEVWFTATEVGGSRALYSATLTGEVRLRERIAGSLTLQDISREGRMLVARETFRWEMVALPPGESRERDLTWLDWSYPSALSRDGATILFDEEGEGGGAGYAVYLRKTDGSPAVRLGEGFAQDLSPDGKWALAIVHKTTDPQLAAYPTGAGEPKLFPRDGLSVEVAYWMPDGKQIAFLANEPKQRLGLYVRDLAGGKPRALALGGYQISSSGRGVSPDGKLALVRGSDQRLYLYPISGGEPMVVSGIDKNDIVDQFSADDRSLYVSRLGEIPLKVYRLDFSTGRKELWRTLMPADAAGVTVIIPVPTPSGEAYAYSYVRTLSDLYLVDGLK